MCQVNSYNNNNNKARRYALLMLQANSRSASKKFPATNRTPKHSLQGSQESAHWILLWFNWIQRTHPSKAKTHFNIFPFPKWFSDLATKTFYAFLCSINAIIQET
jgi:hypothetical protein